MCIAIVNNTEILPKHYFVTAAINNPDGMGLVYAKDNQLYFFKELHDVDRFYDHYLKFRKQTDKPMLIHFRFTTHGKTDKENCHPFFPHNDLGFIHNGIISGYGSKKFSDTNDFSRTVLANLSPDFIKDDNCIKLIQSIIGHSKLCFLSSAGEVTIINEYMGNWDTEGNWFSNYTHLDRYYTSTSTTKASKLDGSWAKENIYPDGYWDKYYNDEQDDKKDLYNGVDSFSGEGVSRDPMADYEDRLCELAAEKGWDAGEIPSPDDKGYVFYNEYVNLMIGADY